MIKFIMGVFGIKDEKSINKEYEFYKKKYETELKLFQHGDVFYIDTKVSHPSKPLSIMNRSRIYENGILNAKLYFIQRSKYLDDYALEIVEV